MDILIINKDAEALEGKLCWQSIQSSSPEVDD